MPKIINAMKGIQAKIFLGYLLKSDLKLHLAQSSEWQRAQSLNENILLEVNHEEKDYLGVWLDSPISYELIKKTEDKVRSQLQLYCPKFKLDTLPQYFFSQIFVN